jgi:GNAT superfamily N-acetyltransferase
MAVALRDRLRPSDRAAIERIVRSVGVFREEEVAVALELVDIGLSEDARGYLFAVAEDERGAIVGYACWGHASMTDAVYDLYWIAVERSAHGRGIGRALLAAAEADVRGRRGRMILIETEGGAAYEPTRRFYVAAGYPEVARVRDYYRVGADKVIFGRAFGRSEAERT